MAAHAVMLHQRHESPRCRCSRRGTGRTIQRAWQCCARRMASCERGSQSSRAAGSEAERAGACTQASSTARPSPSSSCTPARRGARSKCRRSCARHEHKRGSRTGPCGLVAHGTAAFSSFAPCMPPNHRAHQPPACVHAHRSNIIKVLAICHLPPAFCGLPTRRHTWGVVLELAQVGVWTLIMHALAARWGALHRGCRVCCWRVLRSWGR